VSAEENKAVVRRAYEELWNRRNVDVVDELATDDFLNHAGRPAGRGAARG
jgi:hypothetical protein